ncbi:MAG: PHP domain-containing protein [Patescibacteria group bacterium]
MLTEELSIKNPLLLSILGQTDLHLHSSYSDGLLEPKQLVEQAAKKGLKLISITDH